MWDIAVNDKSSKVNLQGLLSECAKTSLSGDEREAAKLLAQIYLTLNDAWEHSNYFQCQDKISSGIDNIIADKHRYVTKPKFYLVQTILGLAVTADSSLCHWKDVLSYSSYFLTFQIIISVVKIESILWLFHLFPADHIARIALRTVRFWLIDSWCW